MSVWYYADRNRNRQGPVEPAALAQLFREGRLDLATLIWRDGMANWQPLGDFAAELGLLEDIPATTPHTTEEPGTLSLDPMEASPSPASNEGADGFGRAVFTAREPAYADQSGHTASPDSPYAAPRATLASAHQVHAGDEVVFAGFWKRVAAYLIDSFVVGIVGAIIGGIIGAVMGAAIGINGGPDGGAILLIQAVNFLVGLAIGATYYGWFHASTSQATLGKMAVGIKVVRGNGEPISFPRGVGRYFALLLSSLTLCIGFLMAAFTQRKQALHDMVCDTLVVDKWAFTAHPEWQRRELGTVTTVILVIGGLLIAGTILLMLFAIGIAASAGR